MEPNTSWPEDKLGLPILSGDWIAYGHNLGRCAGIRIGKVVKTTFKGLDRDNKPLWTITVRGINDDWISREPCVCSRVGTLLYPNRTLVLHEDKIFPRYVQLMKAEESWTKTGN